MSYGVRTPDNWEDAAVCVCPYLGFGMLGEASGRTRNCMEVVSGDRSRVILVA